jgi:putative glycosyltransferase (TIGR04348 family)
MSKDGIVIVTPALADANNGNWQTAHRWSRMLAPTYRVRLATGWDADAGHDDASMIALHARRSAPAIAAWRAARPSGPLVVVLTGTDLYRDIDTDASAGRSLASADRLVVLNELGIHRLPPAFRGKARVVLQSCSAWLPAVKDPARLRAVVVGHLREEKSPNTVFDAARLLSARGDIAIDHIGGPLDPALGEAARRTQADCPSYRWLGASSHRATRARIRAAHLLVHPSRMEGGAHAVIEAIRSGTAVLASDIDGNRGLLGDDYEGYFPCGDARAMADALVRARTSPDWLARLAAQCERRAPRFDPMAERAALRGIVRELLRESR